MGDKSEIDRILWHSLPFHQLRSGIISHLILEPGVLLPVPFKTYFCQYLDYIVIHPYYMYGVNLLSRSTNKTEAVCSSFLLLHLEMSTSTCQVLVILLCMLDSDKYTCLKTLTLTRLEFKLMTSPVPSQRSAQVRVPFGVIKYTTPTHLHHLHPVSRLRTPPAPAR